MHARAVLRVIQVCCRQVLGDADVEQEAVRGRGVRVLAPGVGDGVEQKGAYGGGLAGLDMVENGGEDVLGLGIEEQGWDAGVACG